MGHLGPKMGPCWGYVGTQDPLQTSQDGPYTGCTTSLRKFRNSLLSFWHHALLLRHKLCYSVYNCICNAFHHFKQLLATEYCESAGVVLDFPHSIRCRIPLLQKIVCERTLSTTQLIGAVCSFPVEQIADNQRTSSAFSALSDDCVLCGVRLLAANLAACEDACRT